MLILISHTKPNNNEIEIKLTDFQHQQQHPTMSHILRRSVPLAWIGGKTIC